MNPVDHAVLLDWGTATWASILHASPEQNRPTFRAISNGEGDPKVFNYLSETIWPSDTTLRHPSIRTISVRAIGDTALAVRALGDSGVVKEGTFVSGKDFEFTHGRLRLRTKVENTLNTPEAGGLFVLRTTQELGLDKKGQGKFKKRESVAGAAFLVVPIAMTSSTEVRFVRLGEP